MMDGARFRAVAGFVAERRGHNRGWMPDEKTPFTARYLLVLYPYGRFVSRQTNCANTAPLS